MRLFQRTIRLSLFLTGLFAGLITAVSYFFARNIIKPPQKKLWAKPSDIGMAYEDAQFPARDGVRISGWFIPATSNKQNGATLIMTHGWLWNRLGIPSDDLLSRVDGSTSIDLLRFAHGLHQEGFNLLLIDLRNHGESASTPPVTFGLQESSDMLGAVDYLNGRANDDDVNINSNRIGAVGFSMGANTVLYALPQTEDIKAAIVVQPVSIGPFTRRYGRELLGSLGGVIVKLSETIYRRQGGIPFDAIQPAFPAAGAGDVPILYVQGDGDRWGSTADVEQMVAGTPNARGPLYVNSSHRFGGYQYLIDNPKIAAAFFEQQLPE